MIDRHIEYDNSILSENYARGLTRTQARYYPYRTELLELAEANLPLTAAS